MTMFFKKLKKILSKGVNLNQFKTFRAMWRR